MPTNRCRTRGRVRTHPAALETSLLALQHHCADVAFVVSAVATSPHRFDRLWPAVTRELRTLRRRLHAAVRLIEQTRAGEAP